MKYNLNIPNIKTFKIISNIAHGWEYWSDSNTDATSKFVIPSSLGALKSKFDKINLDK